MNREYAILTVIAASMLSGVGLASADIPSEVKIGGIFDTNWAEGDEGRLVAEIAVNDFNEYLENIGADWSFSISMEDAQSSNTIAFDKIQAFAGAGVNILVGVAFSSHINLAASYIADNDLLVLSHGSQAANLAIDDTVFRLVPNDDRQAAVVAKMLEDAEIEVLVTVVRGDTWGDGMREGVEKYFNGTIEEGFRYNPEAVEFSVEVSILNDETIPPLVDEHGADKVGILYVGTDEFLPMMQSMKYYENVRDVRWFGTNTQSVKTYFFEDDAAKEFANATQFTATRSTLSSANDIKKDIDARYLETYNATLSTYGYAAYDSIWLLGNAILQTQSTDTATLTNAIPYVAAHMQGASGDLTLSEYGDLVGSKFEIWQVGDGEWVQVGSE